MGIALRNLDHQVIALANPGTQAAATNRDGEFVRMDGYIANIYAEVETAGVTGSQISDIHKNGVTIFTTSVKITHATLRTATYSAVTAANQKVVKGDRLTLDVDSVHSGTAALGLWIYVLIVKRDPGAVKNNAPPG